MSFRNSLVLLLALISFVFVSAATSFLISSHYSKANMGFYFDLGSLPSGRSQPEALGLINKAAEDNKVNLYRRSILPGEDQLFFTFLGDPDDNSLATENGVFRDFNPMRNFTVKPYTDFDEYTLLGVYQSGSDSASVHKLISQLESEGFKITRVAYYGDKNSGLVHVARSVFFEHSSGVIFVTFTALFAAAAYHASRRYRVCVVKTVCGKSVARALIPEYVYLLFMLVVLLAFLALFGLPLLYLYNGFAQFESLIFFFTLIFLSGFLVVFLAQTLVFWLLSKRELFEILKGYKPNFLVILSSLVSQLAAFLVLFTTLAFGWSHLAVLNDELSKSDKLLKAAGYAELTDKSVEPDAEAMESLREFIVNEDSSRRVLMAVNEPEVSLCIEDKWFDSNYEGLRPTADYDAVVVNSLYLQDQEVVDAQGGRVQNLPEEYNHVHALVSDSYPYSDEKITKCIQEWAWVTTGAESIDNYMAAGKTYEEAQLLMREEVPGAKVTLIRLAPGQSLFTYDVSDISFLFPDKTPRAGLLVFAPPKAQVIESYDAYVSSGGVFVTDPEHAQKYFQANGLGLDYELKAPVGKQIVDFRQDRIAKLSFQVFIMFLSLMVMILAGVTLTRIYCEINARRHFVELINGFGFFRTHQAYLALTSAFSIVSLLLFMILFPVNNDTFLAYASSLCVCVFYVLLVLWLLKINQRQMTIRVLTEAVG